jgi:hypothetical protein
MHRTTTTATISGIWAISSQGISNYSATAITTKKFLNIDRNDKKIISYFCILIVDLT